LLRQKKKDNPASLVLLSLGKPLMLCLFAAACERSFPAAVGGDAPGGWSAPAPSAGAGGAALIADSHPLLVGVEPSGPPESASGGEAKEGSVEADDRVAQPLPEPLYLVPIAEPVNRGRALSDRFAKLQPWECRAELRKRRIAVRNANMPALGVATPLRLEGPLGPIRFITPGRKSQSGILDCRLVLLLDEIAPRLSALSVKEVHVGGFYRAKSHLPGKKQSPSQHAYGLAADIVAFGMADGTLLDVEQDFLGVLGEPVCGPNAVFSEKTPKAVTLRNIVCDLGRVGAFNYFLTPNYDEAHRNHLHADIKRGARDHVVR
jgi:hypothetical protein